MSNKLFYPICLALVLTLAGFAQAELLVNGDFEAGIDPWKSWGSGSGSGSGGYLWSMDYHANIIEDGTARSGNNYVEVGFWIPPANTEWWGWGYALVFQEHPVTEGNTYQISAWFRDGDADGAPSLITEGGSIVWEWRSEAPTEGPGGDRSDLLDVNGDGQGNNDDKVFYRVDLTEEWTYLSTTEVAPPGAKGLTVVLGTGLMRVNVDIDGASFVELGPKAAFPDPPNGEADVCRLPVLGWTPGKRADTHDVYFGADFNDVNEATRTADPAGVYKGRQAANEYPISEILDFETTYYWRIDEVNAPPDLGINQGYVWSFITELLSYPIENVTATASSSDPAKEAENTVNGSGLDNSGLLHNNQGANEMWLSRRDEDQPAWIAYEFDKVYKLHEMWVWNSNENAELMIGLGAKDVSIEYSVDGIDYIILGTTHEFAQALGKADYAHNTTVDFGGVCAKYVRLTINSNWGGILKQYGLSEVRFFRTPVRAAWPSPDSGAADVAADAILSWRAGREAAKHDVYFSTDEQAVIDRTAPVVSVPGIDQCSTTHDPGPLELATTYYWRVDEVNDAATTTTWQGDIWSFTTADFVIVDDFESYNNIDPPDPESHTIFETWSDGYADPTRNGALAGNDFPPYCETRPDYVHGGAQAMPLSYDNNGKYSEATMALTGTARDWTRYGIAELSLRFRGESTNAAERMYVALNGVAVPHDNPNAAQVGAYEEWVIPLQTFADLGVSLNNVTSIAIGLGTPGSTAAGGAGTIYVDDIRLYPSRSAP